MTVVSDLASLGVVRYASASVCRSTPIPRCPSLASVATSIPPKPKRREPEARRDAQERLAEIKSDALTIQKNAAELLKMGKDETTDLLANMKRRKEHSCHTAARSCAMCFGLGSNRGDGISDHDQLPLRTEEQSLETE